MASLVAEVYKQVDTQEVLAYCGTKMDLSVGASDKQRLVDNMFNTLMEQSCHVCLCSQMEKTKKILIDCLLSEVRNFYSSISHGLKQVS